MIQTVKSLLDSFSHLDRDAGRRLAALLKEDETAFQSAVVKYLADCQDVQNARLVIWLLQRESKLLEILLNENLSSLEEAVACSKVIKQVVDQLDVELARSLKGAPQILAFRILRLLAEICDNNRILPLLIRALREESSDLRSKAAFIFSRYCQNNLFLEHAMQDPDSHVRARAIEGMSLSEYPADMAILAQAATDGSPAVQAAALLAKYRRQNDLGALRKLGEMTRYSEVDCRKNAAWALAEIGTPRSIRILESLRDDPDTETRRYVQDALEQARKDSSGTNQADAATQEQGLQMEILSATVNERGKRDIYVSVTEGNGQPLPDLEGRDFRIEEAGQTVECRVTGPSARDPLALAVVLDCSGSMSVGKIREMTTAVVKSIEEKHSDDGVAIYKYSFDVQVSKLTHGADRLTALLRRPFTGAKTASRLHDAMWQALDDIAPEQGYRAVLAIADSGDRGSERSFPAVVRQFRKFGVPLFIIGFGEGNGAGDLANLGRQAGGRFVCAKDGHELAAACRALMIQLTNHYCLSYSLKKEPAEARVKVEIPGDSAETTAELIAV